MHPIIIQGLFDKVYTAGEVKKVLGEMKRKLRLDNLVTSASVNYSRQIRVAVLFLP